jgi:hypothetical protein
MENREKDKQNKDTSVEFGQKVGRSENLEGGNMGNRNEGTSNIGSSSSNDSGMNESTRRPGSSYDSSSGRSGSSGSMGNQGSSNSSNQNSGSDRLRDDQETSRNDLGSKSESRH